MYICIYIYIYIYIHMYKMAKLKTEKKIIDIIIAWNNVKNIPFILSQPKLLIFLFCECL